MFRRFIVLGAVLCGLTLQCSVAAAQSLSSLTIRSRNRGALEQTSETSAGGDESGERIPVAWTLADAADLRAEQNIRRALQQEASIRCVEKPLSQVLNACGAQIRMPISIDDRALKEAGLGGDSPVTFSSHSGATARASLEAMLEPMRLTWVVRHESLLVTTQEAANTMLIVRVYPVADLVLPGNGSPSQADFESLIELITSTIHPQSWDTVGGPGSIKGFSGSLALVFDQTRQVHEETEQLLAALRKSRVAQRVLQMEAKSVEESPADTESPQQRSTIRLRTSSGVTSAWQIPRTKDGRPFHVQTTSGPPKIGQGFGGNLNGGGAAF